jgi:hypothetical protein
VDTAELPRAAKRDLVKAVHDALRIDNIKAAAIALSGEDPGWLETTIREDLEAAILDSVVDRVAPLLSASADSEGQAVTRQAVLRADLGKAQRQVSRLTLAAIDTCGGTPDEVAEQVAAAEVVIRQARDVRDSMAAESWTDMRRERDEARAVVASHPAIPDDVAEQIATVLSQWVEIEGPHEPEVQALTALFRSWLSAPTTGPAPAAADGEVRALLVHPAAWDRLVDWLTSRGLTVGGAGDLEGIPTYFMGISDELAAAAPQAPAEPTETPDAPCGATEGGMGVDCHLPAGHPGWHSASHTPRTDGTESIGYPFHIQWPRFGWDRCVPERAVDPYSIPTLDELRARRKQTPAAREDAATPDDDEYNDDLGGWNRSAPVSQEGGKP